ncbi:hypothetical protein MKZ38_004066 [Zalerion maritima]|uniref:Uncharacterized protein n=1 Tax=Zalerion maritima TaxID=339359 RepID=A0AAD5WXG1_9PEZI|nr:hypothetical protein MKZ38_004066 [Zalerion maritima]
MAEPIDFPRHERHAGLQQQHIGQHYMFPLAVKPSSRSLASDWSSGAASARTVGAPKIHRKPVLENPRPLSVSPAHTDNDTGPSPDPPPRIHGQGAAKHTESTPPLPTPARQGTGFETIFEPSAYRDSHCFGERDVLWKPWWLRRRTLLCFATVFSLIGAAVSVLYIYSKYKKGIIDTDSSFYYVWTFGPTALMILLTAFWSRVEIQALKYTPWMALAHDPSSGPDIIWVDYTSMFSPVTVVRSAWAGHYLVTSTALTSLFLKVLVVLSTGLLHLRTTDFPFPTQIRLLDTFTEPNVRPESSDSISDTIVFYTEWATTELNISVPFGTTGTLSYQKFETAESGRMSLASAVEADVDALSIELDCTVSPEEPKMLYYDQYLPPRWNGTAANITLQFDGCNETLTYQIPFVNAASSISGYSNTSPFIFEKRDLTDEVPDDGILYRAWIYDCVSPQSKCVDLLDPVLSRSKSDATNKQSTCVVGGYEFSGKVGQFYGNETEITLERHTSQICTPRMVKSRVTVSTNGVNTTVTSKEPPGKKEYWSFPINMERLLSYSIPTGAGGLFDYRVVDTYYELRSEGEIAQIHPIVIADRFYSSETFSPPNGVPDQQSLSSKVFTDEGFQETMGMLYKRMGSLAAHYRLRNENATLSEVSGTALIPIDRLVSDGYVPVLIVVLLAACTTTTVAAITRFAPKKGFSPVDPGNLLGLISLLATNKNFARHASTSPNAFRNELLSLLSHRNLVDEDARVGGGGSRRMRFQGPSRSTKSEDETIIDWSLSAATPSVLTMWMRILAVLVLLGLIVALWVGLESSFDSLGIATVPEEDTYVRLLWTSGPALVMFLVALYASACNAAVRSLAVFSNLSRKNCDADFLHTSFIDMFGLKVVWLATRMGLWTVVLLEMSSTTASFLTIFAGTLFTVEHTPASAPVELVQESWFGTPQDLLDRQNASGFPEPSIAGVLVVTGDLNISYPANTYDNLAFPGIRMTNMPAGTVHVSYVEARVPATRLGLECKSVEYEASFVETTLGTKWALNRTHTCSDGTNITAPATGADFGERDVVNETTGWFGAQMDWGDISLEAVCGGMLPVLQLGLMDADTDLTFVWGKLPESFPAEPEFVAAWQCSQVWQEVETNVTYKGTELKIDPENPPVPDLGTRKKAGTNFSVPYNMEQSIPNLNLKSFLPPLGPSDEEALKSEGRQEEVLDALEFKRGVVAAGILNMENRLGMAEESVYEPYRMEKPMAWDGTLQDLERRRLFQQNTPTKVMISILVLLLVVNVWALFSSLMFKFVGVQRKWWMLDMDMKGIAPGNGPGSIAAMIVLLAGSNVFEFVPGGAVWMKERVLRASLAGKRFRMGWFRRRDWVPSPSPAEGISSPATVGSARRKMNSGRKGRGRGRRKEELIKKRFGNGLEDENGEHVYTVGVVENEKLLEFVGGKEETVVKDVDGRKMVERGRSGHTWVEKKRKRKESRNVGGEDERGLGRSWYQEIPRVLVEERRAQGAAVMMGPTGMGMGKNTTTSCGGDIDRTGGVSLNAKGDNRVRPGGYANVSSRSPTSERTQWPFSPPISPESNLPPSAWLQQDIAREYRGQVGSWRPTYYRV